MRPRLALALLVSLSLTAGVAGAQPSAAPHVDPKAPCYRWPAIDVDGDGVFDRVDHCTGTPKGCTVNEWGCPSDADRDGVCDGLDHCPNSAAGATVDAHGCEGAGATRAATPPPVAVVPDKPAPAPKPAERTKREQELIETGSIRLERILFETGSARLLPESEASLAEAGEALERYPQLEIEIQGHTDTRGSSVLNQTLSQSRAESVRDWLLAHHQLSGDHLVARGYGETEPLTHERNDEELQMNRRVVLIVRNPQALPRGVEIKRD